jgi:hypothetical protein
MGGSKRVTEIIRQERNGHKTTTFSIEKKKKRKLTFLEGGIRTSPSIRIRYHCYINKRIDTNVSCVIVTSFFDNKKEISKFEEDKITSID